MNADRTDGRRRDDRPTGDVSPDDLADGLTRLEADVPLAEVLADQPDARRDLAELAAAADALRHLPPPAAPAAFRAALARELAERERAMRADGGRRPALIPIGHAHRAAAMRRALVAAAIVALAIASVGVVWAAVTLRAGEVPGAAPGTMDGHDAAGAASPTAVQPIRRTGAVTGRGGHGDGDVARGDELDAPGRAGATDGPAHHGVAGGPNALSPVAEAGTFAPRGALAGADDPTVVREATEPAASAVPAQPGAPVVTLPPGGGPGPGAPPPAGEPDPTGRPRSATPPPPTAAPTSTATATSAATLPSTPSASPTSEPTAPPTPYPWPTLAAGSASLAGALRIDDGAGGRPLAGAAVRLHAVDAAFPPAGCAAALVPPVALSTLTDADGQYAFAGIGAGRYVVSGVDACIDGTFWNGLGAADVVVDACGALVIPLADGQSAGSANIAVPAAAAVRCAPLTR